MNKVLVSLMVVVGLVLTVRFLPDDVQVKIPGLGFWRSPMEKVEDAIKTRTEQVLKASATQKLQINRKSQVEAELSQVRNAKQEGLSQIAFLTSELQKCSENDAMLTIHSVSLRKQDVESDLESLVNHTEELVKREDLAEKLIARLQETIVAADSDISKARGEILAARNWMHEKKADFALAEVRRWSAISNDPLVRIAAGEDELETARRELERELAESGVGGIAPTERGRPWSRWSKGHVTSASEIQARANKLLAGESEESHDSQLTAKPVQN